MSAKKVSASHLRSFADIARFLPRGRRGKKVHVSTLHRWRATGHSGVRLRCVRTPSGWRTSLDAVKEFFDRLTEMQFSTSRNSGGPRQDEVNRRVRQTEQQLEALGI